MKFAIALLFCVVAAASASTYYGYDYGFDKPQNFARERKVNYVNGQRQSKVNYIAESVGASSGTYPRDGVPGTGVGNKGYAYGGYPAGYANRGYPAGYAKGAYPGGYFG